MGATYTNLLYHIIFSTKHRVNLITPEIETDLHSYLGGIIRGAGGIALEIGGIEDHVHLVTKFKPDSSISDMLRLIKANSSKWVNEGANTSTRFEWQTGYAAFSISESQVPAVRAYVRNQKEHHKRYTFKEELITLLEKHGIEYDERYIWD
jgi:REP element-mobilizing transposase RayT